MNKNDPICPYHEMKTVGRTIMGENDPEALWVPSIVKRQRMMEKGDKAF